MVRIHPDPTSSRPASPAGGTEVTPADYRGDSVDLYVNSICNLRCTTCFLGDDFFQVRREMSLEVAAGILRWARAAGARDVAILGGEPSLHSRITDLLRLCRTHEALNLRLVTNGTRPFQRLLRGPAAAMIDTVYVSLDGATAQENDAVRGHGAFRQARRTMRMLADMAKPFVITASITAPALDSIDDLLRLAEDSGCARLNIHWVSPTGRARDGKLSVPPQKWWELCTKVAAHRPGRPDLTIDCQRAYLRADESAEIAEIGRDCAVRQMSNLQFMPDGAVYACGLVVDRPGFNGYRWEQDRLLRTGGPDEVSLCDDSSGPGCPVRSGSMASSSAAREVAGRMGDRLRSAPMGSAGRGGRHG
ncbi:radical SAM protein [Actinoplanes sp. N902-109]|uniref:radical SAM protein n=1 Tax=Actinoplanes sp. (strain N902-109) TaxID=649831 RepID=UPI000329359B|nr:radical SAM protein [Actinoplanes sp. N902-109]AGL18590.1 radical SAM domain-containing protein [Actinoplanes sp. N902-109]